MFMIDQLVYKTENKNNVAHYYSIKPQIPKRDISYNLFIFENSYHP